MEEKRSSPYTLFILTSCIFNWRETKKKREIMAAMQAEPRHQQEIAVEGESFGPQAISKLEVP